MENSIQIFENPEFGQVRVLLQENGEPLFAGVDVARMLGYKRAGEAIATHCKSDGTVKHRIPNSDGIGSNEISFINESNLYRLIMKSQLPTAERFQDWVTSEVLPSIRKTGSYSVKPMTHIQMLAAQAQAMAELEQRQLEQAQQISLQETRLKVVEKKNEELEKERLLFEGENFNFPLSQESLPEVSLRDKIRGLVNKYASINQIDHNMVWNKVYSELYYRCGISVRSYKRDKRQTYLDVLTQHNKLQQVYNVVSFMVNEAKK